MKKELVIELNEKELAEILAKHFNVEVNTSEVNVYKYEGNQREPSYTTITFSSVIK